MADGLEWCGLNWVKLRRNEPGPIPAWEAGVRDASFLVSNQNEAVS